MNDSDCIYTLIVKKNCKGSEVDQFTNETV